MPVRDIKATFCSLTGKFASRKMDRFISWESALERDFYYLAENDPAITEYEEQPIRFSSGKFTYTPDARVHLSQRSQIFPRLVVGENIIELKYREDLDKNWPKYKHKFKLAIRECNLQSWKFKILTDLEVKSELLANIKQIEHHMRRQSEMENELRAVLLEELSNFGICDIDELLNTCFRSPHNQMEALPIIWRLIGDLSVGADLQQPLSRKSNVWVMT